MFRSETYQPPIKGIVYVMKPEALAKIFVTQASKFEQSHLLRRIVSPVWRSGIATSIGGPWCWQRRAAALMFTPKSVAAILPAANEAAHEICEIWRGKAGVECEITHDLGNPAQKVVLNGLLGKLCDFRSAAILQMHGAELTKLTGRINYADLLMFPNWTRRFLGPTLDKPAIGLHAVVNARLTALENATSDEVKGPLLELLSQSKDPETDNVMSQDQLYDNIVGSVAAGRETTALSVACALHLLALDKDTQKRVRDEVNAILEDEDVTAETLEQLQLTRNVVFEFTRLYPPAPQIARDCLEDADVAGIKINKGTIDTIPIYAIHRNPDYWDQPNTFDPNRFFNPDVFAKQNRFRYFPLGGGAQLCLGQAIVMAEAVTLVARIIQNLQFSEAEDSKIELETGASLHAKGGINRRLSPI